MYSQEDLMQVQVIEYIKQCTDLPYFHIANQRQTSPAHGAKLKRMGVVAGVSDLFIPRSNGKQHGIFIELKSPGGRVSEAQQKFLSQMITENYGAHVCYSAQEAILIIKSFYGIITHQKTLS